MQRTASTAGHSFGISNRIIIIIIDHRHRSHHRHLADPLFSSFERVLFISLFLSFLILDTFIGLGHGTNSGPVRPLDLRPWCATISWQTTPRLFQRFHCFTPSRHRRRAALSTAPLAQCGAPVGRKSPRLAQSGRSSANATRDTQRLWRLFHAPPNLLFIAGGALAGRSLS